MIDFNATRALFRSLKSSTIENDTALASHVA
jgi:hypothetical protein